MLPELPRYAEGELGKQDNGNAACHSTNSPVKTECHSAEEKKANVAIGTGYNHHHPLGLRNQTRKRAKKPDPDPRYRNAPPNLQLTDQPQTSVQFILAICCCIFAIYILILEQTAAY